MKVEINGHIVVIEDTETITMHVLASTKWRLAYFGHRSDDMDVVLERQP